MRPSKIYLDLDGVLADFDLGVYEVVKNLISNENFMTTLSEEDRINAQKIWKKLSVEKAGGVREILKYPEFKNTVRKFIHFDKTWWQSLKMPEDGMRLWNQIKKYNPVILTSSFGGTNSTYGKTKWVESNLGKEIELVIIDDKEDLANPDSVLIDDRQKIVDKFKEKGGQIILHTSAEKTMEELEKLISVKESLKYIKSFKNWLND